MSTIDEISTLIDRLYTMDRIISAFQKRPIEYGPVSLYANEAHTLKAIAQNEGISQTELSDLMFRTKGATSIEVDKLVEKGLVNRRRVDQDQRRYLLSLTELGRQVHDRHLARDEAHAQWVAEQLGLEEDALRTTNDALARFIQFYSDHYLEHGALSTLREP
mgnify:CR=1 FL=1